MKTKVNLRLVTGDPNLVTKDEIYVEYNADGVITAFKKRNDAGELTAIVDTPVVLEAKKTKTQSLAALKEGDKITVTPSSGKDAMKSVEITITA